MIVSGCTVVTTHRNRTIAQTSVRQLHKSKQTGKSVCFAPAKKHRSFRSRSSSDCWGRFPVVQYPQETSGTTSSFPFNSASFTPITVSHSQLWLFISLQIATKSSLIDRLVLSFIDYQLFTTLPPLRPFLTASPSLPQIRRL